MVEAPPRDDYEERPIAFDEWSDLDALVHRVALTSGDFDYLLHPLCPDCGAPLALEYGAAEGSEEETETPLDAVACDECALIWQPAPADAL